MYLPSHFLESDCAALHRLMQDYPLSTLVTPTAAGLEANHIPLLLSPDEGSHGVLRGHVARANPVWRDLLVENEVLAIFHGPQAYVSPGWYPTKKENGKAVPTWNYAVVHVTGRMRIVDDAQWLRALLGRLTANHEAVMPEPWSLKGAPDDYIDHMIGAVVGMELSISTIVGKWKISQNQLARNAAGVIDGLRSSNLLEAQAMASMMEDHSSRKK